MTDRPDATPRRRRLARYALVALVAVGFLLFRSASPTDVDLSFEVPPSLSLTGQSLPRERFNALEVTIFDDRQQVVSTTRVAVPGGLEGPLTPPVTVRAPRGRYLARVTLTTFDGRRVSRVAPFEIADTPSLRVELR